MTTALMNVLKNKYRVNRRCVYTIGLRGKDDISIELPLTIYFNIQSTKHLPLRESPKSAG